MNGPGHYLGGAVAGMAYVEYVHPPTALAGFVVFLSAACGAGRASPDCDNTRGWRKADRYVPDEALGHGGTMRHRGITHWPGTSAAMAFLTLRYIPAAAVDLALTPAIGWASHQALDAVFGQRSDGSPAGIPLMPWWCHVGVGVKNGGVLEWLATFALFLVLVWQAAWFVTGTPQPWTLI